MRADLLDYELPDELIARYPPAARDGGRMLVLEGDRREHRAVRDFAELVPERALIVLNDSAVRRARIFGTRRPAGGKVEFLLLEPTATLPDGREGWRALGKASKSLRSGTLVDAGSLEIEVLDQRASLLELGIRSESPVEAVLAREGHVPLPPYLGRADEDGDRERYQTVYARRATSVAAPTAGLHLTTDALERLSVRGVEIGRLELAVGVGTFRPVTSEDLDQHPMHAERYRVSPELCAQIDGARARGAPVIAVGTTVVRALESSADPAREGAVVPADTSTKLLIQPGFRFRVVDGLLTNFHQPRSTLLALVSAFAGHAALMAAYREAVREGYRFLSYGDAMWIARRAAC